MAILDKDGKAIEHPLTLCVVMPAKEDVTADFAFDYGRFMAFMGLHWLSAKHRLIPIMSKGTLITSQRQELAEQALSAGADYILWFDTDMRFPRDIFYKLAQHNKHIVGVNYSTRKLPLHPTAHVTLSNTSSEKHQYLYTTQESTGLVEVQAMGFGCVLTHASVFQALPKPYFAILWSTVSNAFIGEDVFFCHRVAEELKIPIYVDQDLSKEIGHEGRITYSNENAVQFLPDIEAHGPPGTTIDETAMV